MKEERGKRIKLKRGKVTLDAMLISCPGRDVAISVRFPKMLSQKDVASAEQEVKNKVKEWYDESGMFDNKHFICICNGPTGYKDDHTKHSMVFCVDVSVYSIKEVQMGKGEDSFVQMYSDELDRLMLMLD